MFRVFGLWFGPDFVVQLTAVKNFYLRSTLKKINTFVVINNEHFR